MKLTCVQIVILFISLISSIALSAQTKSSKPDSTGKPSTPANNQGPKPYKDVITSKAISDKGLFWVHKIEEKYFIEIPDSLFGREILVVNRISKAAADMRMGGFFGYAGDQIGQNVIRFEKGPNNKIFIRTISFAEYSKDSTSPMFTAVKNSNVQPIVSSFDMKALGKDSCGAVIDITDFVNGDNDVLYFNSNFKSALKVGGLQSDKSYIVAVKSYPINIEIKTVKTYSRSSGGSGSFGGSGNMTMELNSSLVLLPKTPMKGRYFDPRVGFFNVGYTDYDENPQGVKKISLIKRWRLEPKDEDMEKYKRGELVVPKKQIVFYIDPATPVKWVPYLIEGVNDWQKTFEKAGFMNAIVAKKAPAKAEDSTWSLDDATNSAIVYKPSDIANASGPSIADPRSGEIIESHVNWYHNVMSILHDWYFVQAAPNDARARKMVFDDELMGQLIRFVSSHEIGHTLGLRHNYGSSSTVPVENLRNRAWVETNGHTPSIMDYARFNYVAQPEDSISEKGIFPRIGDYDTWAIEWGYRNFDQFKSAAEEKAYFNKWVIEKLKNKRLWFGSETNPDDPRSQSEQVGDDAMKGSMYGIKNLQRIVPNLLTWTKIKDEDYSELKDLYGQVGTQFNRYINHVAKYVGGIMETPKMIEEEGAIYEIVAEQKQKEAVGFLNKQLFTTPTWLINKDIFSRTGLSGLTVIGNIQDNVLNRILSNRTFDKLIEAEATLGNKAFQITDLLAELKKGIWSELPARKSIDVYRRNLQKSYVNVLGNILNPTSQTTQISSSISFTMISSNDKSDATSVVRAHLTALKAEVTAAAAGTADLMSKYHLQDIAKRIDRLLDTKN